jgi:hypothetical protein
MDVSTQVDFDDINTIDKLIRRNHELEKLHYNTLLNSGEKKKRLSLHEEIEQVTINDELMSLRKEFKHVINVNKQLRNKDRYTCCPDCSIL